MHYVLDQLHMVLVQVMLYLLQDPGFAKTTSATANKVIGTCTNPGSGANAIYDKTQTQELLIF